MVKIAITGSTGLIGSRIIELLNGDFEFIPLIEGQIDITKKDTIWNALKNQNFDILFHLAAYTNVDGAEQEIEKARRINIIGTKNVFDIVKKKRKKFIYVSTDFIFDGKRPPFYEDSIPHPLSYYAQTKFEGENIVKNQAMIVRFSYPYRAKYELKSDFVKRIKMSLEEKKSLPLITNSLITPTFIDDIVLAMKYLLNNYSAKIFHIVGADSLSPFHAGNLIAKMFNLDQKLITQTTFDEYLTQKAPRPQYSEIKSKKNNFYRMKTFEEGLREIKYQISNY